jgi:hypothetical protein
MDFVLGSISSVPRSMKDVCASLSSAVGAKFGENSERTFLAGFFFLRFLVPALTLPQSTISFEATEELQKVSMILSRILQAASVGKEFENEDMFFANEIIQNAKLRIDVILGRLSSTPLTPEHRTIFLNSKSQFYEKSSQYGSATCQRKDPMRTCSIDEKFVDPNDLIPHFTSFFREREFRIRRKMKKSKNLNEEEKKEHLEVLSSLCHGLKKVMKEKTES